MKSGIIDKLKKRARVQAEQITRLLRQNKKKNIQIDVLEQLLAKKFRFFRIIYYFLKYSKNGKETGLYERTGGS